MNFKQRLDLFAWCFRLSRLSRISNALKIIALSFMPLATYVIPGL